jgi:hypothetical protein
VTTSDLPVSLSELDGSRPSYNAGALAFAAGGLKAAEANQQAADDVLLRCWRFDAARESRFYYLCLAADVGRRWTPLMVEHAGAREDAARLLARWGTGTGRRRC